MSAQPPAAPPAVRAASGAPAAARPPRPQQTAVEDPTAGNELLTALTGVSLLVPLAVIGLTLLRLHTLLWVHLFVGMLLIPPVALKLASTGYRFIRYYTNDPDYRRKGPPHPALRALAPALVAATVVVLASGVALLLAGPSSRDTLLPIHKLSFIAWVALAGLHVLGHAPTLLRLVPAERLPRAELFAGAGVSAEVAAAGSRGRALAVAGAFVAGVVLALLLIPEFGAWTSVHAGSGH